MDRNEWKERLIETGLPIEVVDAFLSDLDDDALKRMKETPEEIVATLKEAAEELAAQDAGEKSKSEDEDVDVTTEDDGADSDEDGDLAVALKEFGDGIVERVREQMEALEITVEAPDLAEIVGQLKELREDYNALETALKEMQSVWDEILKSDTERLHENLKDLSPAQRVRLRASLSDAKSLEHVKKVLKDRGQEMPDNEVQKDIFHRVQAPKGSVIFRTVDGREFEPSAVPAELKSSE